MTRTLLAIKIGIVLVAVVLGLAGATAVSAAVDRSSLTNLDQRLARPRPGPRPEQSAAHEALKQRLPKAVTDFDPALGTPKWVHARDGFLTGANGAGGAVARETAQRFEKTSDPALKSFLQEHRALFRHGAEVLDGAKKTRDHTTDGLRTTAWEQQVDGIPVFDSVLIAHTGARGELISVSSLFVPDPARAADLGTPNRAAKVRAPAISAERALRLAVDVKDGDDAKG